MSGSATTPIEATSSVPPTVLAGLLLCACAELDELGLRRPSKQEILSATGAGRSRAHVHARRLRELLPTLAQPVGRPRKAPPSSSTSDREALLAEALAFTMAHPGCVSGGRRRRYSDHYRCFIVECYEKYRERVSVEEFAVLVQVPVKTLKPWIQASTVTSAPKGATTASDTVHADENIHRKVGTAAIVRLVEAWQCWDGNFESFVRHAKDELGFKTGKDYIRNTLEALGARPVERRGRLPDELALRKAFELFFPGAQWIGDGTQLAIDLNGERFTFNLELLVDAASGAFVGATVGDQEDAAAVVQAFFDGVATAGLPPLAVLLDNRSSNLTEDVEDALGDTLLIRATRGRAQNKGHVEGAFGLFEQMAPALYINAHSPVVLAARILELIVVTWARTLNHKSRRHRGGLSRVQQYRSSSPTTEQLERARAALAERQRKQILALEARKKRQDPASRRMLDDAFAQLGLDDPTGNIRLAIAGYPLNAIIEGISTFVAKKNNNALPDDLDDGARYLLGIVRNLHQRNLLLDMADELNRLRHKARDLQLEYLHAQCDDLVASVPGARDRLDAFLERVTKAEHQLNRLFWLRAIVTLLAAQPPDARQRLFDHAIRRLALSFRVPHQVRDEAIRFLARTVFPVE
jgi:hypothetical protein